MTGYLSVVNFSKSTGTIQDPFLRGNCYNKGVKDYQADEKDDVLDIRRYSKMSS